MRRLLPISIYLVFSSCCANSTPPMDQEFSSSEKKTQKLQKDRNFSTFAINYSNADLKNIEINNYRMTLTWHTLKRGLRVSQQSLTSYDRHNVKVELSPEERSRLEMWIDENHLFSFKDYYPPSDSGSYGAAFESSLILIIGSAKKTISWDDTSYCPELREAVNELCKLTEEFKYN